METFFQDLRYSIRMLISKRAFAVAAVLTLALGIGANTAIFSFVNGVLLRPLPFDEPDRLIVLGESHPEKARSLNVVSPRNLEDWEKLSENVEQFGAWRDWGFRLATPDGPIGVPSAIATPSLFQLLKVRPALGRAFLPEENQKGNDHVVMLAHSYWLSQFGGDKNIINQSMTLSNESFTVVGILPPEFESLQMGRFKVWAPVSIDPDQDKGRHLRNRRVYARLKPNVTVEQATAEMKVIAERLAQEYPKENGGWVVSVASLHETEVGAIRSALMIFLGAVGCVLLIACANVANLLLVRAATRKKEFAIRAALGAGRFRVLRQLLTESVVLSLIGGALGLLLAFWLIDLFIAINPNLIPRAGLVKLDSTVLGFTFLLSLATGVIFGLVPALKASRINLVEELKEGQKGSRLGIGFRLHGMLVVTQVALALVMLVGAGLLGQSFARLNTIEPGYNPANLVTLQYFLPFDKYKERSQVAQFYREAAEQLKTIPGVESIGGASAGPQFGGYESIEFLAEGHTGDSADTYPRARYYDVGPDYFRTMQIPIVIGREFADSDNESAQQVAVINQSLAASLWPNESAIGKRITIVRSNRSLEIIGIVGDVKRFGLDAQVEPEIYWPFLQQPRWATFFALRTSADPSSIIAAARIRFRSIDPDVFISNASTMEQLVTNSLKRPKFNLLLFAVFAGLALLLAAIGLYGVISYSVAQRTHEIGVRMALGAQSSDIFRLVVRQGVALAVTGVAVGIIASLALTRILASWLFGVSATDPLTIGAVSLILVAVAVLACYVPARRAMKVDPMVALRYE